MNKIFNSDLKTLFFVILLFAGGLTIGIINKDANLEIDLPYKGLAKKFTISFSLETGLKPTEFMSIVNYCFSIAIMLMITSCFRSSFNSKVIKLITRKELAFVPKMRLKVVIRR